MSEETRRDGAENGQKTTRRTMLKAVSAGAAVGLGLSSAGSASAEVGLSPIQEELKASYFDASTARTAFLDHAGDVLTELSGRGVLERGRVDELSLDTLQSAHEYVERDGLHVTAMQKGGVDTAHLVVSKETPTHDVEIVVQPERERAYARALSKQTGETEYVFADEEVSPQGPCYFQTYCGSDCCNGNCTQPTEYEEECCVQGGVTNCETYGPTGSCCDCC